jgi:hypothetical protein
MRSDEELTISPSIAIVLDAWTIVTDGEMIEPGNP